jgi:hypothetical protein
MDTSLLHYWVEVLGLESWTIKLVVDCSPNDMTLANVAGEAEWDATSRSAIIRILDPKDYGDRIVPFDPEKTLVHELLHLKFAMLDESGDNLRDRLTHQIIDDLAKALVRAKRDASPGEKKSYLVVDGVAKKPTKEDSDEVH